jgi:cytochrome P450
MLAHNDDTRDMSPRMFLGNLLLLIVGGNDTTRNSISGGVLAMNRFPDQFDKLKADRSKIPNAVAEIIRWQTPLAFMRRTTTEDVEIGGTTIPEGERVLMWYAAGNRDETVFAQPERLDVDRDNARQHLSFGYGVHRCMGNRVAELQLNILWEELLNRYSRIEVAGAPVRAISNFVRGYTHLPVRLRL